MVTIQWQRATGRHWSSSRETIESRWEQIGTATINGFTFLAVASSGREKYPDEETWGMLIRNKIESLHYRRSMLLLSLRRSSRKFLRRILLLLSGNTLATHMWLTSKSTVQYWPSWSSCRVECMEWMESSFRLIPRPRACSLPSHLTVLTTASACFNVSDV